MSLQDGKSCMLFFYIFKGLYSLIRYRVIWESEQNRHCALKKTIHISYFKVFYAPSTKCEFNVPVVQLVLTKFIYSIFHEPLTLITNRKQVSKVNRWVKENKWVSKSFWIVRWNEIEVNVAICRVNCT